MSTRLMAFEAYATHGWHAKNWKKLSQADRATIHQFIKAHDHLGHLEFEYAVNRMFLLSEAKPKNWTLIQEFLVMANTAAYGIDAEERQIRALEAEGLSRSDAQAAFEAQQLKKNRKA